MFTEYIFLKMYEFASFLILIVLSSSEGKTGIGDYIVDCSACNSVPVHGMKAYSCKVRCEAEGEYNKLVRLNT